MQNFLSGGFGELQAKHLRLESDGDGDGAVLLTGVSGVLNFTLFVTTLSTDALTLFGISDFTPLILPVSILPTDTLACFVASESFVGVSGFLSGLLCLPKELYEAG